MRSTTSPCPSPHLTPPFRSFGIQSLPAILSHIWSMVKPCKLLPFQSLKPTWSMVRPCATNSLRVGISTP